MPGLTARQWIIRGRVQGVGFRAWVQTQARLLGLAGWTRNAADGSVVVVAAGEADTIAAFARLLHEGPPYADVRAVTSEDVPPTGRDSGPGLPQPFVILRE